MSEFNFFRQQRQDGGIRSGLNLDEDLCWHSYEPGGEEDDPALSWYVDVRGKGAGVPSDPEELRDWLINLADPIRSEFLELADHFEVGVDDNVWPVRWSVSSLPPDTSVEIVFSAARRIGALQIAETLREIGKSWRELLAGLQRMVPSS